MGASNLRLNAPAAERRMGEPGANRLNQALRALDLAAMEP